ncbi:MAG TPA: hypothetical protein VGI80_05910 [Pyrinomonadaceae bacterium]|jgi:hypothetical protein
MKIPLFLILFAAIFPLVGNGQGTPSGNDPNADPRDREQARKADELREKQRQAMRDLTEHGVRPAYTPNEVAAMRGDWEKRLKEIRKVDPSEVANYRAFLKSKGTGVFRLLPNFDCVSKELIKTDGECSGFVPDMSDFSFRIRDYSDREFHDIGYLRDEFVTDSFFSQGILVSLGNVPIEDAGVTNAGMKFLVDLLPDTMASAARRTAQRFKKGVVSDGFTYSDHVKVAENTTYALRFIGYKPADHSPDGSTAFERKLSYLDYYKRLDTLVIFRVVRLDPTGPLTIVWKELSRKNAMRLKFNKDEKPYDFTY